LDEERKRYFKQVLDNAPVDDEPFTEEDERASIESKKDIREGKTVSIQEFAKTYLTA